MSAACPGCDVDPAEPLAAVSRFRVGWQRKTIMVCTACADAEKLHISRGKTLTAPGKRGTGRKQ